MNILFCIIAFVKEACERGDGEIIESVLAGNQNDFEDLIKRYQGMLYAYLYRFLFNNAENAKDVLQNVFMKAYKNLGSVDVSKPLKPWLYRIAHNEAVNFIRAHKRKGELQLEDEDWDRFSASETSELEEKEKLEYLKKVIDGLKTKYREVLLLHYFEEKSYQEISDIMKHPKSTIGVLINRAKKQILKKMPSPHFFGGGTDE